MANLRKSRTLFFPTSPRSPYKLPNELKLLTSKFSGKPWGVKTQKAFASLLSKTDFFKGYIKANDDFAARDRINRAPKSLGFVDLKPKIRITPAGKHLLNPLLSEETFTRQLMKFQLPSFYHVDKENRYFVKPYLEILRLIFDLGGITKTELAIFGMQLIDFRKYGQIKSKITGFRTKKAKLKYLKKKEFIASTFSKEIKTSFRKDILSGRIATRESEEISVDKFIQTKQNNMIDYADACIRYLVATGLVRFDLKTRSVIVKDHKVPEVKHILTTVPREPEEFSSEQEFKQFLFSSEYPVLLSDNRGELLRTINSLASLLQIDLKRLLPEPQKVSLAELKSTQYHLEEKMRSKTLEEQKARLQTFAELEEIVEVYKNIAERDVVDPSLFFEWNTWRAMVMLDDGNIYGNFKADIDGSPMATAPANMPDIECKYEHFNLIVEVTLSSGQRQYEMEGEPVARHLGLKRKETKDPIYCLFIAPKINEATLAHFYALHKISLSYYGGTSHIIPMDVDTFVSILRHAKQKRQVTSIQIKRYIDFLVKKAKELGDENEWFSVIKQTAPAWTSCIS